MEVPERADAVLVLHNTTMSEVEEVATDTDSATSQPPAKKMKAEQSSSDCEFLADLLCTSATSAVHDELDSYLTYTDSGPDVLS